MPATYKLTHYAACGMPIPLIDKYDNAELEEARQGVARRLRYLRREGYPISVLEKGREWEISDPDDSIMVSDNCGILCLRPIRVPTYECWICGFDIAQGEECNCNQPLEEEDQSWRRK
jgi:hypothetical protein